MKGYISSSKFIDNLYELASESESDAILRRIANSVTHQGVNLKSELQQFDLSFTGQLDKMAFKKCLKQHQIAISDNELDILLKDYGEVHKAKADSLSSSKKQIGGGTQVIKINQVSEKVNQIGKSKPLPGYVLQGPKGSGGPGKAKAGGSGN